MSELSRPCPEEVEHLLLNARLRDELEPYCDEPLVPFDVHFVPTPVENEFLASILAWERAPVRPIREWFDPPLAPPSPAALADAELRRVLWDTIRKLHSKRIVLDFTDHLSDRQLYQLIWRDILPSPEKHIESSGNCLHWDCVDACDHSEEWLRFYASDEERNEWAECHGEEPPPRESPPYPRNLPGQPL